MSEIALSIDAAGIAQIQRLLDQLPANLQRKAIRPGLRALANMSLALSKSLVPTSSGQLRRSLKVRAFRTRRPGWIKVGVVTGAGMFLGDSFYGGFIELGWQPGRRVKRGARDAAGNPIERRRARVAPHPYLRDAIAQVESQVEQVLLEKVEEAVGRLLKG